VFAMTSHREPRESSTVRRFVLLLQRYDGLCRVFYCVTSGPSPEFTVTISQFFPQTGDAFRERVERVLNSRKESSGYYPLDGRARYTSDHPLSSQGVRIHETLHGESCG